MRHITFLLSALLLSCGSDGEQNNVQSNIEKLFPSEPVCPHGHKDSIIPMVYGMPSEELFAQADSGLVALGGCEITDDAGEWWCKIHHVEF